MTLRVLIIEPAGRLWGSERALLDLINALEGAEVAVCCPANSPFATELKKRKIRAFTTLIADLHRGTRWARLLSAMAILRAVLTFRPNVIHLNQAGIYRVCLPAAAMCNVPMVCHVRLYEDITYLGSRRPSARRLKAIVAISESVRLGLAECVGLSHIPVYMLYDAYSFSAILGDVAPSARVRQRIACVGRLEPRKGQDVLVDALRHLGGSFGEGEVIIAGTGEEEFVERLRASIVTSGCSCVTFCGFVDDVPALLRSCEVLVLPSHREPLGRVIFEAWEAGALPVVCATSGGAAEVVEVAQGGIIYANQTAECLATALHRALTMSQLERESATLRGRQWVIKNCSTKRYGQEMSALFSKVSS